MLAILSTLLMVNVIAVKRDIVYKMENALSAIKQI
jgi:hypothetical protein